ncbi:hypothetical protein K1Y78_48005 [Streptomyces sp. tea 10]|nr:hypothetical protein [Streptomyces sp. tea 10]
MLIWYLGLPDRVLADTSTAAHPDAEDTSLVHLAYDRGLYGSLWSPAPQQPRRPV